MPHPGRSHRRFYRRALLLLPALVGCTSLAVTPARNGGPPKAVTGASRLAPGKEVRLTILHTNDVHGHLTPQEYAGMRNVGGVARRATLLKRLGAGRPDVLVMD